MVGIAFNRLVGPQADVKELEFISSIHQTCHPDCRTNGTIKAIDIVHFLCSRHSIHVKEEVVKKEIIQTLCGTIEEERGGGDNETNSDGDDGGLKNDMIDLCQIVALLIIPFLVEKKDEVGKTNVDKVFNLFLNEARFLDGASVSQNKIYLTSSLLTSIFENYGERRIPPNIIQEMLSVLRDANTVRLNQQRDAFGIDDSSAATPKNVSLSGSNHMKSTRSNMLGSRNLQSSRGFSKRSNSLSESNHSHSGESKYKGGTVSTQASRAIPMYSSQRFMQSSRDLMFASSAHSAGYGTESYSSIGSNAFDSSYRPDFMQTSQASNAFDMTEEESVTVLDRDNFLWILTNDVTLYNPEWEERESTIYDDSKGRRGHEDREDGEDDDFDSYIGGSDNISDDDDNDDDHDDDENKNKNKKKKNRKANNNKDSNNNDEYRRKKLFKPFFSFRAIDQTADMYKSPVRMVFLWLAALATYFAYVLETSLDVPIYCNTDSFVCMMITATLLWLRLFCYAAVMGFVFIILSSFGNVTHHPKDLKEKIWYTIMLLIAIIAVCYATTLTFVYEEENVFFATNKSPFVEYQPLYYTAIVCGGIVMVTQLLQVLSIWTSIKSVPYLSGGTIKVEARLKQAARLKVRNMIKNALATHYKPEKKKKNPTAFDEAVYELYADKKDNEDANEDGTTNNLGVVGLRQALQHYDALDDAQETAGGTFWAWGKVLEKDIYEKDGIWLPSRLFICNLTQLFAASICAIIFFSMRRYGVNFYSEIEKPTRLDNYANSLAKQVINAENLMEFTKIDSDKNNMSDAIERLFELWNYTLRSEEDDVGVFFLDARIAGDILELNETDYDYLIGSKFESYDNSTIGDFNLTNDGSNETIDNLDYDFDPLGTNIDSSLAEKNENVTLQVQNMLLAMKRIDDIDTDFVDFNGFIIDIKSSDVFLNESTGAYYIGGKESNVIKTNGAFIIEINTEGDISDKPSFTYDFEYHQDFLVSIIPSKKQFLLALNVGGIFGAIIILTSFMVLVPSYITTVLKYRFGDIESLDDPLFSRLRTEQEQVTVLIGSAFWGMCLAGIISTITMFIIVLVAVSTYTREYTLFVSAQLIGILITIIVKIGFVRLIRNCVFAGGFYRNRPLFINVLNVVLECWNVALTSAYMIMRTILLYLITTFYLGRIDTPMLAPGVGHVNSFNVDVTPDGFRKDLLAHEAHRHPYIERLGLFYLMKLRHGEEFGKRAGSYWRLLFVLALMPWLHKYRVTSKDDDDSDNDVSDDDDLANLPRGVKAGKVKKKKMKHKDQELEMLRKTNRNLMISTQHLTKEVTKLRGLIEGKAIREGKSIDHSNKKERRERRKSRKLKIMKEAGDDGAEKAPGKRMGVKKSVSFCEKKGEEKSNL